MNREFAEHVRRKHTLANTACSDRGLRARSWRNISRTLIIE